MWLSASERPLGLSTRAEAVICPIAAILALFLAISVSSAHASSEYPLYASFGHSVLTNPYGVAIDQSSGDIYVGDEGSDRVFKFNPSGELVAGFGTAGEIDGSGVPGGFGVNGVWGVAVDNSSPAHNLYVSDTVNGVVDKFDSSGNYICQITGAGSATTSPSECDPNDPGLAGSAHLDVPAGLAVDGAGTLYVGEVVPSTVDVFSQTGKHLRSFYVQPGESEKHPIGPASLAVDGEGNIYAASSEPSDEAHGGGAHVYGGFGAPNTTIGCPSMRPTDGSCPSYYTGMEGYFRGPGALRNPTGNPASIAIDPANEEIFVGDNTGGYSGSTLTGTSLIDRYNHAGAQLERFAATPPLGPYLRGIGVYGRTGQVYVSDVLNRVIDVFGPPFARPVLVTGAATHAERTQGTLNGTVNPETAQLGDCHFDYGLNATYSGPGSGTAPCAPSAGSIPADSTAHAVSAEISGLTPREDYHYRLSVTTTDNVLIKSGDRTFTTLPNPPTASTGEASAISQTGALLSASVNPQGAKAEGGANFCKLEWGTDTTYSDGSAPCFPSPTWSTKETTVSASVDSFNPNTLYHFRVSIATPGGSVAGADRTFATLPNRPAATTGTASAITPTSATLSATVNPQGARAEAGANSCRLEWWIGSSTTSAPCSPNPSDANVDTPVSVKASGLLPGTLYHYWIVVSTTGGNAFGSEQTFMTKAAPARRPKCKRGFKKIRVHGKSVCRKIKRHRGMASGI